jgi:transposase InsO family protein
MDITYIPMARGFVHHAAVIDWFSRKVLAWKLSITRDTGFCIETVTEALASLGRSIDGFYNIRLSHLSLDRQTPDEAYFTALRSIPMAAEQRQEYT